MTYTARTTLSLAAWDAGPEFEVEMVVSFTVSPARPQTRLEPAEAASPENISIRLFTAKGATELCCPTWLEEWFADDGAFHDWLLSEAAEQNEYQRDCAAEARAEEGRIV